MNYEWDMVVIFDTAGLAMKVPLSCGHQLAPVLGELLMLFEPGTTGSAVVGKLGRAAGNHRGRS